MPLLRVHLLGGLRLLWGDQALPSIRSAAARSLFAYLVTYRDRPHTRDLLAGTFWPDLPDTLARRRLSRALWQIRRVFRQAQDESLNPQPVLLAEGDTVQFNPDLPLWLDVEELRTQSTTLPALSEAVELYRGDFMAGYYDDWLLVERERLREVFLGSLERLVSGFKAQGDYEQALAHARQLATEDPLREEAHREVMRLCHLLERDHEALQQYETCRRILADEMGTSPAATTKALAAEIARLAGEVATPHLPVAPRPAPLALLERPDQVVLVGRHTERAELARLLELATTGNGGMALLQGAMGVGKTRLVQEVARDAAWRGIRVAWGYSCELSAPAPYQPLAEVLRDADLTHLPEVWQRELGRLIPSLPAPPPLTLEPEQEKGRLLEALARAFLALGQTTPHLIILEDVHWMDPASFEALRVLLPRLATARLLVMCTLRSEELAEQPAARRALVALEGTRIPRRLELAPLTEAETGSFVQQTLSLARPAPRFSRRLYAGTAGNPFFVAETLWALVEEGMLYRDEDGAWSTPWDDVTDDYAELPVSSSITQSIQQRLERLSPTVRDLLGVASVIGRRIPFDLWVAAGECDEETTLSTAEELAQRGLLAEMDAAPGYCFAHDAIHQVVYAGLSAVRRLRCHCRVASVLERLYPNEIEALARHFELGQDWPQAVRYARRAGERAQAIYANQQALDYYHHADVWLAEGRVTGPADQAWPENQVAQWRAELAEKQGQVHSLVGEYAEANAAFSHAWQALADLGSWQGAARVLNQLSFLSFIQDDYDEARRYAGLALDALPEEGSADLQAVALTHLGLSAWAQKRYDDAQPALKEALALFEKVGSDPHGLSRCLNSLGLVHLERGEPSLADRYFARSLTLRREIGDRRGEAWCRHNQGRAALAHGDAPGAREKLEAAQAIFDEIEHPYGQETCARFLAEAALVEAQANAAAREACRLLSIRLPRADASTGRPLRDDEYVTITWTVEAPADRQIQPKVARRHQRLLRLLEEAQAQGAAPTHDHLAQALGVSRRTIERDVASLRVASLRRQKRTIPPTRGKMSE